MKVAVLVITTVTQVMVVLTDAESYVSQSLIVQNRQVSPTSMCWDLVASFCYKKSVILVKHLSLGSSFTIA